MNDCRYALRILLKNPVFTGIAILTLALGIGLNTTIFGLLNAVLIRPLPQVADPERLVQVGRTINGQGFATLAHGDIRVLRDQSQSLEALVAYSLTPFSLSHEGTSERLEGEVVSGSYFQALGVPMAAGRPFLPEEDQTLNTHPVAVISHGLWTRRFGGDPNILSQSVILNSHQFKIIGVAAAGFGGTEKKGQTEVWVPMSMLPAASPGFSDPATVLDSHVIQWTRAFARIKPGISMEQAVAELNNVYQRIQQILPEPVPEAGIGLVPGVGIAPQAVTGLRIGFTLLQAVVGLVLLIACANVSNMQLARSAARVREMSVRLALGAKRWHIGRQLLTENLILAAAAGAAGVALSFSLMRLLGYLVSKQANPMRLDLTPDTGVILFATGATLLTALITGLIPAWQNARAGLVAGLREGSTQSGSQSSKWRNAFVISQVALSFLLLVGTGLFVRAFQKAISIHPGYAVESVIVGSLDVGLQGYDEARGRRFYENLLERVQAIPGVAAAGLVPFSPLSGGTFGAPIQAETSSGDDRDSVQVIFNMVTPDLFRALEIPVVRGRGLSEQDLPGSPEVVVLDEATAARLWPGGDPIGQRIRMPSMNGLRHLTVVGVVRDVRYRTLLREPERTIYLPFAQNYQPWATLHVRASISPTLLFQPLREAVASLDKDIPLHRLRLLSSQLRDALFQQRFMASVMSFFGSLALTLAALGIYGVLSYSVNVRKREMGVRMAMGARPCDLIRLVLGEGGRLAGKGFVIGLIISLGAAQLLSSKIHGLSHMDPIMIGSVILILAVAALIACFLPALRASRVEPMVALREE